MDCPGCIAVKLLIDDISCQCFERIVHPADLHVEGADTLYDPGQSEVYRGKIFDSLLRIVGKAILFTSRSLALSRSHKCAGDFNVRELSNLLRRKPSGSQGH